MIVTFLTSLCISTVIIASSIAITDIMIQVNYERSTRAMKNVKSSSNHD